MTNYKWVGPYDWLADTTRNWSKEALYNALCALALQSDADTIQDLFQEEMSEAGYFESLNKTGVEEN